MDGINHLPFFNYKYKIMACTSCKKKTTITDENSSQNSSQFKMRNTGVHQISFGSGNMISNSNMTDELAIIFLKENPNRITLFEVFPENWKDSLTDKPVSGKRNSK